MALHRPLLKGRVSTAGALSTFLTSLLAALLAVASAEWLRAASDPVAEALRTVLLGGLKQQLICPRCPEEPVLRMDAATGRGTEIPLPYQQVNDLAPFPDGSRFLIATSSEKGRRSQLLVLSAESLAPLGRVEIPGNGRRVVISPDGYFAYVLGQRPRRGGPAGTDPGKWELLGVDLGASAVAETYPLSGPVSDLALSPAGDRLYLALAGRVQSFTTQPLTASWFYRSPGENRALAVRPREGEIFVLRDLTIAIFESEPRPEPGGPATDDADDASLVIKPPTHLDRIAFSGDGRLAVAAGRGLDELLVLDAGRRRIVGTWPENDDLIARFLKQVAAAERPPGPRGKLAPGPPGFSPPLAPVPGPALPSEAKGPGDQGDRPKTLESGPPSGAPPASPEKPGGTVLDDVIPPASLPSPPAEAATLEEVAEPVLEGRLTGEISLVKAVTLYGPDNITLVRDRVVPGPDGVYSFALPPPGRYRILPTGDANVSLSFRPAFRTIEVGEYGFRGLDFQVVGAIVGGSGSASSPATSRKGGPDR